MSIAAKPRSPVQSRADLSPGDTLCDILDSTARFISKYVILTRPEQADELALWVAHTYVLDAADTTPYQHVTSVEKRSGKSRLLEVCNSLVSKPYLTGAATKAVLVRLTERDTPTILLDELDAVLKGRKEDSEPLRAYLNSGYRRGLPFLMCEGPNNELREFKVFSPKMLAGIGTLWDTVGDRAIRIELLRKLSNQKIPRWHVRRPPAQAPLIREWLTNWCKTAVEPLIGIEPTIIPELDDRASDVWEPLLAIAELAGDDWPERARKAAVFLSTGEEREDESFKVRLLRSIRSVFGALPGTDRLASETIVSILRAREDEPWGAMKKGAGLDTSGLAFLLKPYRIKPTTMRIGRKTPKGYYRESFEEAWARYVVEN